ncbi:MAG: hypothetical protein Hyperionvirus27_23 [Hyperionvirus sp.]|uniref:Uncharacterized protein n=1 Tax=Hyperionvirus sp. TaxID=2487770 RepID=A0A3G5AF41_9VIRU|nr:MAG: hypothetical protein Hyperionvirus27_23 [Hyperionvirus sp.]
MNHSQGDVSFDFLRKITAHCLFGSIVRVAFLFIHARVILGQKRDGNLTIMIGVNFLNPRLREIYKSKVR